MQSPRPAKCVQEQTRRSLREQADLSWLCHNTSLLHPANICNGPKEPANTATPGHISCRCDRTNWATPYTIAPFPICIVVNDSSKKHETTPTPVSIKMSIAIRVVWGETRGRSSFTSFCRIIQAAIPLSNAIWAFVTPYITKNTTAQFRWLLWGFVTLWSKYLSK